MKVSKTDYVKRNKKEVKRDVALIKLRLFQIEMKKKTLKIKRKTNSTFNIFRADYGLREGPIPFPFMTFENDDRYLKFMTQIMRKLESRFFMESDVIYKELDQCLEVYFVLEGKYNVGYEINKIRRFRK